MKLFYFVTFVIQHCTWYHIWPVYQKRYCQQNEILLVEIRHSSTLMDTPPYDAFTFLKWRDKNRVCTYLIGKYYENYLTHIVLSFASEMSFKRPRNMLSSLSEAWSNKLLRLFPRLLTLYAYFRCVDTDYYFTDLYRSQKQKHTWYSVTVDNQHNNS